MNHQVAKAAKTSSLSLARLVGWRFFLSVAIALSSSGAAHAQPQRLTITKLEYPWSAIGRLNVGNHSYCSAVMISERHILTAAHCLWLASERRWWPPSAIQFVPGFQGDPVVHTRVKSYVVADGYSFDRHRASPSDWAVAELAEPLGRQVGWLASGGLDTSGLIGHAGYRADHRYAVTLDYGCRVLAAPPANPLLWENCEDLQGDSGGPVLAFLPGGPRVVGIVVATTARRGGGITAAVAVSTFTDRGRFPKAASAATAAGVGRGEGGHPPAAGSAADHLPAWTFKTLGAPSGQAQSLADLAHLLERAADGHGDN